MQRPQPETVTLDDVLITEELSRRSPRPPNWQAENQAMHTLARQLVNQPETMLQSLVDMALDLCTAETAGVSLLETTADGKEFRWTVLAGTLAQYVGGTSSRNFSPCGVCLDRGTPVLFAHPERYFTYFQAANTPIVEGLVLPLIADNHALGTIWIMSHDQARHFDSEDVRVMTSLADFTAAALFLKQQQTQELLAKNAQLEVEVIERKRAEEFARERETRLRAMIENLPGGAAFVVDRDLRYLLAQGEALAIAGFKPEDFVGQTIFEVLPPELAANYEVLYRKALAGEPFEQEHYAHARTYISRGTPLRAENGEIYAVLAVSYDITDRKRSEEALRESEERFRTLANTAPALIWYNDAQGNNRFLNQYFLDFTGKNAEQIRGEGWHDLIHPDDAELYIADYLAAVREQRPWHNRNRIRRHDGVWRWHDNYAQPLFNADGVYLGHVGVTIDNTDTIEAEIALRESEAKYRSLFDSIDEGFCLLETIYDEADNVIDYRFLEVNQVFERQSGLKNVVGKLGSEIASNTEPHWLEAYHSVVQTGEPTRIENYNEDTRRWYSAYISRFGGADSRQVAVVFNDISDRRQSEQEIKRANRLWRTMFDNSLQFIQLFKAVRDERGDIVDFEWLLTNKQWNDCWGEMAGKRMLTENPAVIETGLFEKFKQVTETGVAEMQEHHYAHEQFDGWFLQTAAKVEDGFLLSTLDITDRKRREANLAFLNVVGKDLARLSAPEEIFQAVGKRLSEFLGLSGCVFADVDEAKGEITGNHGWTVSAVPSLKQTFRFEEYVDEELSRLGRAGENFIVCDTATDERVNAENYAQLNIGGVVAVPFLRDGRWKGYIAVTTIEPRDWQADEIELLQEISTRIFPRIERARAEAALRESEEKFAALFAASPVPFMVLEANPPDFTITAANEAYFAATLTTPEGLIGRRLFDVFTDDPNRPGDHGSEALALSLDRVLTSRRPDAMERTRYDIVTPDGGFEPHWWLAINAPLLNASGQITAIIHQVTRVTELHLAEEAERKNQERQAFLLKLSDALRPIADPLAIQREASRILRTHLGAIRVAYLEKHEDDVTCTVMAEDKSEETYSLFGITFNWLDFDPSGLDRVREGQTISREDVRIDDDLTPEQKATFAASGFCAFMITPLVKSGRMVAYFLVHFDRPHKPVPDEITLLEETADRTWAAVERVKAEQSLRTSEAKYRTLFTSIDEGFTLLEMIPDESGHPADFRIVETNPVWEQQTGLTDAVGRTLLEVVPNFEQQLLDFYIDVVISGRGRRTEYYTASVDRWYTVYASRIGGEGNRQVAVVFNDISDRKRTEEQQAFLLKFSDALRAEPDADSVANRAVRMLAEHLHLDRVWLSEVFEQQGISTVGPEYHRPDLPPMSGIYRLSDYPETMRQLATQPMVIHDVASDPDFSDSEKALLDQLHIRSLLVVSLRKGQHQVIWALVCAVATPRYWNESERVLLEQASERIWAAIERARAEAALRESELQRVREQSEREQERQRAESLAELARAKTTFFSNVSHEFRTPLTLLLAPLEDALSDRTLPPIHRERLELTHRNSLRLLKLVNTLLDFSRIESGRIEAVYEPTDLAAFTSELASVFRSAIEQAGLRLIVDCLPLPEPVYVDREMWEKIVLNLISNAFKFTLNGEIRVSLHPVDHHVIFEVQDTGTGIAPEELPHLFERFYQARLSKAHAARSHEGSGIGLALVHELVQLQGGIINVSSTLGQGSCFTITLPFGVEHLPQEQIKASRTLTSTSVGATAYVQEAELWLPTEAASVEFSVLSSELEKNSLTQNSQTARILLVDDNPDIRDYLTRILSKHAQVTAVADGAAALSSVQAQLPDLILSDVMMPNLDGFELLQALRSDPRTREIPIILLSARAGEEAIVAGLEAGADDYLIKPFSAQELVSRVNAHLQTAKQRSVALHEARTTLRQKDELLSTISHELNTPLVSILGWTRLLRSNPPNLSMLTKALDTIERNATLQAKLVQDLLDISRISAGKLRLHPQPVELAAVIETAIAAVLTAAIAKNIHVEFAKLTEPALTSVSVLADADRLQQVICNLLTNAIKFTPEQGQIAVKLEVICSDTNQLPITNYQLPITQIAQITITDTGIGISAEFLPHIFDRFHQAESGLAGGLGLGLAIAQHLVELHNGTIHAYSAGEGQGSTFVIRLPLLDDSRKLEDND
ncbi:ATP-binding protein [Gloeocapsopsis sp. IPPAS B-1203]|uniref:ATP-binding protein n=1 Tax=Gloeocapsopsis sp. IPPAS B-1203 TaxID=2049454 RepID=UPI000C1921EE|nr:ATP-binding protein [Gloeocapsopsis sp. IPPAS B-1203]PIG93858.1 histidine kinase [Gloeocapsopsis sp. IPPAS B-1203]